MTTLKLDKLGNLYSQSFNEIDIPDVTDGLVARWPFNNTLVDTVGGNDATKKDANVSLTTNRIGEANSAYQLDNVDVSYKIQIPSSTALYEVGDLTFCCLCRVDESSPQSFIMCHYNWSFYIQTTKLSFRAGRFTDSNGPSYAIDADLPDIGKWYFLTGLYHPDPINGWGYLEFYVNGTLVNTVDIDNREIYTGYGTYDLQWGNSGHGAAVPFVGAIGESRIYNRILIDNEIKTLSRNIIARADRIECLEFIEDDTLPVQARFTNKGQVIVKKELIEV